jgi:hypothetical protein
MATTAAQPRLTSPSYTRVLFQRFRYVPLASDTAPPIAAFSAGDYRNISALGASFTCAITSCGLAAEVDLGVSSSAEDSLHLCLFVDGVKKDCSYNATALRVTGARLAVFTTLAKGSHTVQVKAKTYFNAWTHYQAIAHYSVLAP